MKEKNYILKIFIAIIFILIINSSLVLAGTSNYKDIYEIKGKDIEKIDQLRSFEGIRFRYDNDLCVISINSIEVDKTHFYLKCRTLDKYESFTMQEYDKKLVDLNDDGFIDFSFSLDKIIYEGTKKRINFTFSTDIYSFTEDFNSEVEENTIPELIDNTIEETSVKKVEEINTTTNKEEITTNKKNDNDEFESVFIQDKEENKMPMRAKNFILIIWLIVLLLVSFAAVGFYYIYKKKHNFL